MTTAETTTTILRWQDFVQKVDPIDDRTLRWNDVLRISGLKKSQVKEKIKQEQFPGPFLITDTGRSLGWHSSEIKAWCVWRDALREAMRGQPRVATFHNKSFAALKKGLSKHVAKKKAVRR